ncbi:hypothetical protein HHUSO_G27597 [Huso huso]|uniref:Peptidase M12A domain-containing protein n=1 Tax=Huso huso TaxID=61971 RepID=A0ABR0YK88_HUSHU
MQKRPLLLAKSLYWTGVSALHYRHLLRYGLLKVDEDIQVMNNAIREFDSQTCIRFVPRKDEIDYLSIKSKIG